MKIFLIVGWWLAVLQGQPPQLEGAACSKRHSLSSHGKGQRGHFLDTEIFRKKSDGVCESAKTGFPEPACHEDLNIVPAFVLDFRQGGSEGYHRGGFVSVSQLIWKREPNVILSVGAVYQRYGNGGSFLKLVAEPCFWIILLVIPILPPVGDNPVEPSPGTVQVQTNWLEHVRSLPRVIGRERNRSADNGPDARSRSIPSTPSSRMAPIYLLNYKKSWLVLWWRNCQFFKKKSKPI